MKKSTLILIGNLNEVSQELFNQWITIKKDSKEFKDLSSKLHLLKVITKNIEEQERGFLKSKVKYKDGGKYFLENYEKEFEILHKEISLILLK